MPAPGGPDRLLVAGLSPALIPNQVLPSALDSLTVLLIVVLFSAELLIIVRHFADGAARPSAEGTGGNYVLARPAAFFYVFGIDLSMSFLPLHVERLYKPLFGLSREVVAGLPISAEFLSVGVAILVAGVWYDRRGWQQPMFVGLVLATGGALGSCLATDVTAFILSRVLVGTGYGFALMASQGYVIGRTDGRTKAQGLAHLFAGLYAGSICGGAAGGILAERYGYRMAFLLGALAIVLVIPYVVTFMRDAAGCVPSPRTLASATGGGARRLGRFLSDRSVLALMLLSSLPASIAAVGFLNYFSPLYLSRLGASETTIGKLLVIYGVCLIYLGPVMGRHADASESRRSVIFAGCLLGGAAFLAFNALDGVLAVAVAILLMGLSHSMVLSSQSAYMLELQVTRELGPGMALGIFRASSRFGQMVGPMVFSAVAMSGGMQTGVGWLGVVYVVLAVLFLLLTRERREVLVREYSQ
jgi:predicted MFS family arabinose efflux permease